MYVPSGYDSLFNPTINPFLYLSNYAITPIVILSQFPKIFKGSLFIKFIRILIIDYKIIYPLIKIILLK